MKIFVDTANLKDIEEALKRGFIRGITTNPSLLSKEPKTEFKKHIERIIGCIRQYQPGTHLSVEVFSRDPGEILRQARDFRDAFQYDQLSIKVQVGWDELMVIRTLSEEGFSVNCTACMSITQAVMAAAAGARYVSLFWGRIRDGGIDAASDNIRREKLEKGVLDEDDFNPLRVVGKTRAILDRVYPGVEIIVGSIRRVSDIRDAAGAGAHIVTVPPKFFPDMITHFKTDEVVAQFLSDFKTWMSS